jgi:hypothetical protein
MEKILNIFINKSNAGFITRYAKISLIAENSDYKHTKFYPLFGYLSLWNVNKCKTQHLFLTELHFSTSWINQWPQ